MPEDVQCAVHSETRDLLANADPVLTRLLARDVGRDVNVADDRDPGIGAGQPEGDHVGRALPAQVLPVQCRHRAARQERDGNQGIRDALRLKHRPHDARHAIPSEGSANAVRRDIDDERHGVENSAVTPPPAAG